METSDETKDIARRTIASAYVLRDNLNALRDMEIGTTRHREVVGTYKTLLLVIYTLESNFVEI